MRPVLRLFACTLLAALAVSAPAAAATPASGTVSLASPTVNWSGKANGYLFTIANDFVGTCQQPYCDRFSLTVAEAGQLTVAATAATGNGFTRVEIRRPDGTWISDGGASGQRGTSITIKNAAKGDYLVWVLTNRPVHTDGSYTASATLAAPTPFSGPAPGLKAGHGEGGAKDATVIAVIDSGMNPYHWDFLASRMPQNSNADPGDDLPLHRPAGDWLPGFDDRQFASVNRLDLSIEEHAADTETDVQREEDADAWKTVKPSKDGERHLQWFPGTKFIGALTYSANGALLGANDAHGVGVTSSSAGNMHGTCPECLLFFINHGTNAQGEKAIEWAMSQPWIDVVTNSYGFHWPTSASVFRPNVYSGSNTDAQRSATERGQTVFFSAGNGVENAFVTPNLTTFSSQKGPDWMVTVGAVTPGEDGHYESFQDGAYEEKYGPFLGAGKPVDLAGVGSGYPTAYSADTVSGTGSSGFSGTSNATPHVAGLYARTLYLARTRLAGKSKVQRDGVVADGRRIPCGATRPDCELGDGKLTARELRDRLLYGTLPSLAGLAVYGVGADNPSLPKIGEEMLLSEGHGVYRGRVAGSEVWQSEQDRVFGPMVGTHATLERPAGEREWFIVDSYCRQRNWGAWGGGYYVEGKTTLPPDDPSRPVRAAWARSCPGGRIPAAGSSRAEECRESAKVSTLDFARSCRGVPARRRR